MVGGQMLDIEAERPLRRPTSPADRAAAGDEDRRAAALRRWAGAIVAGGPRRRDCGARRLWRRARRRPSRSPTTFSTPRRPREQLGKRAGKDAARNKATFVTRQLGIDGAKQRVRDLCLARADAALSDRGFGGQGRLLRAAARFVAARAN